jgi:hypothetical protein
MFIIDQRNQQVLEGRILVPTAAGLSKRIVEGLFELASETRHLGKNSPPSEKPAGFTSNVIRGSTAIKGRGRAFQQIIASGTAQTTLSGVHAESDRAEIRSYGRLNSSSAAERWICARCM